MNACREERSKVKRCLYENAASLPRALTGTPLSLRMSLGSSLGSDAPPVSFTSAPVAFVLSKIPYVHELVLFAIAVATRCVQSSDLLLDAAAGAERGTRRASGGVPY